jgi:hypothetical protein
MFEMWCDKTSCNGKKMKILLLLLNLFFVTSCAGIERPRFTPKQKGINQEFKPYIENYRYIIGEGEYSRRFNYLHMNFAKLNGSTVGRCWWLLNGELEVEIDVDYWQWVDFVAKEFLVYHELEHCIRQRMHTNSKEKIRNIIDFFEEVGFRLGLIKKLGYLKDGCPASLMHTYTLSSTCRAKHYYYYLNEIRKWEY